MNCPARRYHCNVCELCESLATAENSKALLDALTKGCLKLFDARASVAGMLDRTQQRLHSVASEGLSKEFLATGAGLYGTALDAVVLKGEVADAPDVQKDEKEPYRQEAAREGLAAALAAPLMVKGRCVGILRVYRAGPGAFTEDEKALARTLATQSGAALERFRLHQQAEALGRVSQAIGTSLDQATVLQTIAQQAAEILGFRAASIRLLSEDGKSLEVRAAYGLSDAYMAKGPVEVAKSPFDQEVLGGKEVVVTEAEVERKLQYPEEARREGIRAILGLPLYIKGRTVGVLRVYSSVPYRFTEDDIEFLKSLASQGAIAIENARLFEHLLRDYNDLKREVWKWYDWGERPPRM